MSTEPPHTQFDMIRFPLFEYNVLSASCGQRAHLYAKLAAGPGYTDMRAVFTFSANTQEESK